MVNEMRILKFETLTEDIENAIKKKSFYSIINKSIRNIAGISIFKENETILSNPALALIYDYDKTNHYGKIIMKHSSLYLSQNGNLEDVWTHNYENLNTFKEERIKIKAAKELVKLCKLDENRSEAYKFIFWALMILAVDKSNYDEHLSLICDFARMFKITDDEMDDIVQVIKFVFHDTNDNSIMKTDSVKKVFEHVFDLFK